MDAAGAFRTLQADPRYAELMRDSYMTGAPREDAARYRASAEFAEVERLLRPQDKVMLDLGAGTGIASFALADAGAKAVFAVEPDPSEVGRGAIADVCSGLPVELLDAFGEKLPLADRSVDAIYARQVLHHADQLEEMLVECARVLRPRGLFLASREHVVDDDEQLRHFLDRHPVHQLAGNENAFPLVRYLDGLREAGLEVLRVLGPWDSILNAFPRARSNDELIVLRRKAACHALQTKLGRLLASAGRVPVVADFVWRRLPPNRTPGRLYSFLARQP